VYEFHVSREARDKYEFDKSLLSFNGNVVFVDFLAARRFTKQINSKKDLVNYPEQAVRASNINAIGLIDEIFHMVVSLYRQRIDPLMMQEAYTVLEEKYDKNLLYQALSLFTEEFPPVKIYLGEMTIDAYLDSETNGTPNTCIVLEEIIMLWITNQNLAVGPFMELFDDSFITKATIYYQITESLQEFFKQKAYFGPDHQDLITMLRSPAIAEPYSLTGQLEYIRRKWGDLIGDYLYRLLNSLNMIREEAKAASIGESPTRVPSYEFVTDVENFSQDSDWMPRTVMIAKNTYVWLHQLSIDYHQEIKHLNQVPDKELEKLANWGFNGLWLIGLWERSLASKWIKQRCGNPEAVASAYSLKDYSIAEDLGGDAAYQNLRDRAWQRGIRLASDMVPNHMGIDSNWVIDHPDWFISLPHSPFPSYSFDNPDLSPVDRVGIFIEDGYYNRADAAVVFKRVDKHSGETRFIYHGNDGTNMPWNDTAQLDYLKQEVREAVIQTILHVARKFPIIRFDAAMTLAKKHYQRLWFPAPGTGGAIPSRAEHGLTNDQFDKAFPEEFWREVVDRVAQEVPDTLLLAEAFWLMEGYFVRTLGMHRVYNSAFMNMLRNEENTKYRLVIKNTLEFDPQILKRYVNFMNNPDEKTAVEQFGKGDKYFGICTLMVTMPGLPMFGHGQIEGFAEKYGMEYYRPYLDEEQDKYLIQRHQQQIFPLLKRRDLFAGVRNFFLYDFYVAKNQVYEDVFAYSNGIGNERALVVYHNRYGSTQGWVKFSTSYLNKETGGLASTSLFEGLNLKGGPNTYVIFKDGITGMEYIRRCQEVKDKGLNFQLDAYTCHVFMDFHEVEDNGLSQYAQLTAYLNGRGVPSIDEALRELMLAPVLNPLRELINPAHMKAIYQARLEHADETIKMDLLKVHYEKYHHFIDSIQQFTNVSNDVDPILAEQQQGLESILKLQILTAIFHFPGSKKYAAVLKFIQNNLGAYPFIWFVLIIWNDLHLMGQLVTQTPQSAEISRSWFEEWGILRIVEETLIDLGFDQGQAQGGVKILKLLTSQQNWMDQIGDKTPLGIMQMWLSEEEVRGFLNVNRYKEKLWFNKEAFESMMWWMMTIALIQLIANPEKSLTEVIEVLFEGYESIQDIQTSGEESEYQVSRLLEGLK